ncbi:glycosyltransferase [Tuanshanicoccus lijuaniae]|uniref:glycosyltransferase n=1 Tax=Aerococcaceae bacterium zg-1292 TaxID=2774330 RepID=UPI001BD87EB1|nr:glycosyltransferase [Aerococcaceae bacterium zg-A91]MBS4457598.1 glycosyltransferase [Aerococcaceae bacterium zg-BR33]
MRVLHIMSGFGGGISSFIQNKAIGLLDSEIVFDVATYDEVSLAFRESIEAMGGEIYRLINPKKESWQAYMQSFESIFRTQTYDVVHCHIVGYRAIAYYVIAKKYVSRFYIHAHDTRPEVQTGIKNKALNWLNRRLQHYMSDVPLGCGDLAIQAHYGMVDDDQMMVLTNGIEDERFFMEDETRLAMRQQLREQYQISDETVVIGQVGRLEKVKNTDFTLALARYLKEQQLPAKIFLVGDGALAASIQATIEQEQLQSVIVLLGRVSPIETVLPLFNVLMLPSFAEGLPTIAVEAQALGIPIVTSDYVSREADFGLGMFRQLTLEEKMNAWYVALEASANESVPPLEERRQALQDAKFTQAASTALYKAFLLGEVNHYHIAP